MLVLLLSVVMASIPAATAEFEFRKEVRAGDVLYNSEVTILPVLRALFHQETLAHTGDEAFAMSPLSATGDGVALAQASTDTTVASQTGLFAVTLPFLWVPQEIGDKIGDRPEWAADVMPINIAGIPANSMMIFPSMTMITRMPDGTDNGFTDIIDANASIPMYPGNIMLVKNSTDDEGQSMTTLERQPRDYLTPFTSAAEIANKTIIQRMWGNSHINYNLDRAYVGETCRPELIYPVRGRDIDTIMPMVPDRVSIDAALNMTHDGMHMRRLFWPVA